MNLQVGDYMPNDEFWYFDDKNKTSHAKLVLKGRMSVEAAQQIRLVLRGIISQGDAVRDSMLQNFEKGTNSGVHLSNMM